METTAEQRFVAIVVPHFEALYRAAVRLTRGRHDAEDLLQDVCLKAYSRLTELEKATSPRAWLLRVQYHLFVDGLRRERRSPVEPAGDSRHPDALVLDAPSLDDVADGLRLQQRLERAWQQLQKEQRALLALHAEGYDLAELEQICGISRNAVSARLHRAQVRLAKLLDREARPRTASTQTEN